MTASIEVTLKSLAVQSSVYRIIGTDEAVRRVRAAKYLISCVSSYFVSIGHRTGIRRFNHRSRASTAGRWRCGLAVQRSPRTHRNIGQVEVQARDEFVAKTGANVQVVDWSADVDLRPEIHPPRRHSRAAGIQKVTKRCNECVAKNARFWIPSGGENDAKEVNNSTLKHPFNKGKTAIYAYTRL